MRWLTGLAGFLRDFGGTGEICSVAGLPMSFDVLARHYRWMEFLLAGDKLQRCRTTFLDRVEGVRNILIVGEGNGRFLGECRRRLPAARITCVDASEKMLALAGARLEHLGLTEGNTSFVQADALEWVPPACAYDLIVTQFFLDCFPADQLKKTVINLTGGATPEATWLLADFNVPPTGVLRYRAKLIHLLMYAFFRAVTKLPARELTPPEGFLQASGFELRERQVSEWGLLHTDRWVRTQM